MDDRETTPLLGGRSRPVAAAAERALAVAPWYQLRGPRPVAVLVCLSMFLWVFAGTLAMVPARRIAEDIICHHHYSASSALSTTAGGPGGGGGEDGRRGGDAVGHGHGDGIPERLCKGYDVQSRMAVLFGLAILLDGATGLLAAFPFGALADRARRPVYLLGAIGQSLNVAWALLVFAAWRVLPVELILLGPVFQLLGGGLMVATAVLYAMLADVLPPENR
jgi:hypothetical protein